MSAVRFLDDVDIEQVHSTAGVTRRLALTLTQAIDLRDAADALVEKWDEETPKTCRFCSGSIVGEFITSTDGRRSHPACYQQWVQKTLKEIA